MDWLSPLLFDPHSIARTILILTAVCAVGLLVGKISVRGVSLGIAGVLFSGILFGHLKLSLDPELLEFTREFGLILFVYMVGLQVGPGFFSSLKERGLQLVGLAALIVVLGLGITLISGAALGINQAAAVGIFAGATTNTPALGAGQQAMRDLLGAQHEALRFPGLGYAVAYPFGILGIILTMVGLRVVLKISPQKEAEEFLLESKRRYQSLRPLNIVVENKNLDGLSLREIPGLQDMGVVVSRVLQGDKMGVAGPDTVLHVGDIVLAVGSEEKLSQARLFLGREADVDLRKLPSSVSYKRVVVTNQKVVGETLQELALGELSPVTITRVQRGDVELVANADVRLQFGDVVIVVGEERAIARVASELGDSSRALQHFQLVPTLIGIMAGIFVGSIPFSAFGMSTELKLGLAGGPLIVALIMGRYGNFGPFITYVPFSANMALRELGITLFLASVGLKAGDQFIALLLSAEGLSWLLCGMLVTLVPIMIVAFLARLMFRLNYLSVCGLISGAMTDPPALAFANAIVNSNAQVVSYATVYPFVMVMRVIAAQLLVVMLF